MLFPRLPFTRGNMDQLDSDIVHKSIAYREHCQCHVDSIICNSFSVARNHWPNELSVLLRVHQRHSHCGFRPQQRLWLTYCTQHHNLGNRVQLCCLRPLDNVLAILHHACNRDWKIYQQLHSWMWSAPSYCEPYSGQRAKDRYWDLIEWRHWVHNRRISVYLQSQRHHDKHVSSKRLHLRKHLSFNIVPILLWQVEHQIEVLVRNSWSFQELQYSDCFLWLSVRLLLYTSDLSYRLNSQKFRRHS